MEPLRAEGFTEAEARLNLRMVWEARGYRYGDFDENKIIVAKEGKKTLRKTIPWVLEYPIDSEPNRGDFIFSDGDEKTMLSEYRGQETEITIPDSVKKILSGTFENKSVTTVNFSNVEEIGPYAFKGCTLLEKVVFTNVLLIGESAFEGCEQLKEITFQKPVKLYNNAFKSCTSLANVNFVDEGSVVRGKHVFLGCDNPIIAGNVIELSDEDENAALVSFIGSSPYGSAFDIIIPENVIKIEAEAFMESACVKSVDFSNVRVIEHHAFEGCKKLETVKLNEVIYVGISAFEDCDSLESVEFMQAAELAESAFYQCTRLRRAIFAEAPLIGDAVFERCYDLETVISKNGFQEIGESAFDKCKSLIEIDNLSIVETIGSSTFRRCSMLKRIDLPLNIETVKESVFSECKKLTIHCDRIRLQFSANWNCGRPVRVGGAERIGETEEISREYINNNPCGKMLIVENDFITNEFKDELIRYIGSESSVRIPQGIFVIHHEAFINCRNVEEVFFNDVEEIGNYAFDNCENLRTVHFEKVFRVGKSAFEDCEKLTKIVFPAQEIDIIVESSAFFSCKSLREVVFEGNVKRIDYAAFGRCRDLRAIVFKGNCRKIENNAFEKCEALSSIGELKGLIKIGNSAFRKCRRLGEIRLPETLKDMGDAVFAGCDAITIHHYVNDWADDWAGGQRTRKIES
ncbi:MAG: leucine-rich repeat domain-containing protein [Clostridiales bacterium]|jgi:hypothetical protein|nr:leucine-rich repeat domain-containing protein [Clostridiales bacterium]